MANAKAAVAGTLNVGGVEYAVIPMAEYLSFTVCGAGNQSSVYPEPWPGVVCPRIETKVERIGA